MLMLFKANGTNGGLNGAGDKYGVSAGTNYGSLDGSSTGGGGFDVSGSNANPFPHLVQHPPQGGAGGNEYVPHSGDKSPDVIPHLANGGTGETIFRDFL